MQPRLVAASRTHLYQFFAAVGLASSWPWLAEHSWLIAATTLVLVGTYQFSNLKARALAACRRLKHVPIGDAVKPAGVGYGIDCVGASGGLMLLALHSVRGAFSQWARSRFLWCAK